MLTINPPDTRKFIQSVRSNYNLDLSEIGFNLLRYRISKYLEKHLIKDAESLIARLLENETSIEEFLSGISAGSSELFRDPGMWKYLRMQIIPQLFTSFSRPLFWIPRSVSGHDAFSLLILLAEENFINRCQIYSSTSNFVDLEHLKAGILDKNFIKLSSENYLNGGGKKSLKDFFNPGRNCIKSSLTRKIKFTRHFNLLHDSPEQAHFIMIRNQLLNFTQPIKNHILNNLAGILPAGGILVLGVKEQIEDYTVSRKFKRPAEEEGIYRKVLIR